MFSIFPPGNTGENLVVKSLSRKGKTGFPKKKPDAQSKASHSKCRTKKNTTRGNNGGKVVRKDGKKRLFPKPPLCGEIRGKEKAVASRGVSYTHRE